MRNSYDVVVIGGGAAGLSGAVTLARSLRSVLVVDAGDPRNAPAEAMHNYLGREGTSPLDLVADGRQELEGYGGEVVPGVVTDARPAGDGFVVTLESGESVQARRLLLATGLRDELPAVEGLAARWGKDVIHCPYCHGYEHRGRAIGVLASTPLVMHQALMFRQLSDDVVVFTHTVPDLGADALGRLAALGVRVVEGEVAAVEMKDEGVTGVRLASGEVVEREVVVVAPRFGARVAGLEGLGLEITEMVVEGAVLGTSVQADPATGKTNVPGVWAAGNVASMAAQVVISAGAGLMAGSQINYDLILEDAGRAVEAAK
ncbi:NAD(P)/FAD-dependent oxidoreductase [Kineosporia mesophila]|uniref:NAD(P)/FAD-dependent oxidoreductase n=1 Tax=Kineosporia mesophila TaxID=566012 RepID=A0ABP6ZLG7_9ACTN|nr:NAD(P)/FAD-dependent oxidoreductase [Kineosporia mesophila]MCD5349620.1 NAD(P)/FAD-dependent oxidoreductase [Kineosporia mesophila]